MEGEEPIDNAPQAAAWLSHKEVLRRMIVVPEPEQILLELPPDFEPLPETPLAVDRVAAVALGRTADRLYGLPIFVESVQTDPATPAELVELFPERALLAVVQGRGDRLGVVALCPSLIASLIEMQAIGRVSSRSVRARKPTRTDASISAEFVNGLLNDLGRDRAMGEDWPDFSSYSYASFLDDSRPLLLMLEDAPMSKLSLRFRIGAGGQRDGSILIALPQKTDTGLAPAFSGFALTNQSEESASLPDSAVSEPFLDIAQPDTLSNTLHRAVQQAPVSLVGVLHRRRMTLRALRALKAGDLLTLPADALNEAQLETGTGQILAKGRLGEADGQHAIRLHAPQSDTRGQRQALGKAAAAHQPDPAEFPDFSDDGGGFLSGTQDELAETNLADLDSLPTIDTSEPDSFRDGSDAPSDGAFFDDEAPGAMMDLGSLPGFG